MSCPTPTSAYPLRRKTYVQLMQTVSLRVAALVPGTGETKFVNIIRSFDPFAMLYTNELIGALNNKMKSPGIVVESYESSYDANNSSNMVKTYDAAFIIVGKQNKNDYSQQLDLTDQLEEIGELYLNELFKEFLSRFNQDASGILRYSSVKSDIVGPFGDNWWGQRFVFQFHMPANRIFNN